MRWNLKKNEKCNFYNFHDRSFLHMYQLIAMSCSHQHNMCGWRSNSLQMASLQGTQCILNSQSDGYHSQSFSPWTTPGDINDLNPDDVYQFSVVAEVTIMERLYSGKVDASLAFQYSTNSTIAGKNLLILV